MKTIFFLKRSIIIIASAIAFLYILVYNTLNATNYYFSSSSGDDTRTTAQAKNSATPWKTLSKLNSFFSSLAPGDSVLFKRGDIFYGTITAARSGTSSLSIVFGAYGSGDKPLITGNTSIASWINIGGNIWESSTSVSTLSVVNAVSINGVNTAMGRYPNSGYLTYQSHSGNSSITSSSLTGSPNWSGAEVVIRKSRYILDRSLMTSQSGGTLSYSGGSSATPSNGFGFFIQNDIRTLDQQGEWYFNPSTKKIDIYSTSSPANVTLSAADYLVYNYGYKYITFDNLSFQCSNTASFYLYHSDYSTIQNCDFNFSGRDAVWSYGSVGLTIQNCNINNSNSCALFIGGYFDGNSSYYGANATITNNTVSNSGNIPGMGYAASDGHAYTGINTCVNNVTVTYNSVTNSGYHAITFDQNNSNVSNNFIDTFCSVLDDGAGIYTWDGPYYPYTGRKVQNNIVINGMGAGSGAGGAGGYTNGIYLDDGSPSVEISGNTTANCDGNGIFIHNSHEANIHDNTCFNNSNQQIYFQQDDDQSHIQNLSIKNNLLIAKTTSQLCFNYRNYLSWPITNLGVSDNNYWARPMNDNLTFNVNGSQQSLSGWRSYSNLDVNSKKSPKTVSTLNDIRFEYNATSSNKIVNLGATYIGIDSTIYPGTITLAPYSSKVLIYLSGTIANQPPVANAGTDKSFFLPTNTVTLTGSGTDADGTIASYQWTKIAGPTQFTIVSPTQAQTVINNLLQGIYQFELKVTDNLGAIGRDTVVVTVNAAANQSPVANAGTDKTITLPTNTVTLTGSGTDADGTIASYQWTKIAGPAQFTIVSPTQAQTVINNLVQGVYQFELKVTDNLGAIGRDTVVVTVNAAANQSPVANAGTDKTITLPTNTVTLTGSGTDADGTIASYQWTKIAGPAQFTIVSPTQAQTVINNLVQGVYQFELKVTDNLGAIGRDTVVVTVNAAANQSPVANAGSDKTITLPTNTITLTGSGADSDGTIASYQWTKIAGPAQFTIVSPTQAQTVINNLVQGVYQFELKVTDNLGAIGRDTVVVTVNAAANQSPVANAGNDKTITLPTSTVTLTGSGTDADGTIVSYQWTKIAGPSQFTIVSPTQAQTVINNLVQGVYQFELKVTDNLGAIGRDTVAVTVNAAANQSPVANSGTDKTIILPTNTVTLTGSGTDADGTIASYKWKKISGPFSYNIVSSTQAQTVINNLVRGVYKFELKVTDNQGATGKDTVMVTVNAAPSNQVPVADAGSDKTITLPTNTVTLTGSGTDSDGTIASYKWTKISGPSQYTIVSSTQAQTVINNLVQGVYQFELKVTDNLGATGRDTVSITVNAAPPNQAPVANAGADQNITLPTNTVTLIGNGADTDGSIASYQWIKISGPTQFTFISPNQPQTITNNLAQGVYQFELKVTDDLGATGRDTVSITVNAALPNQAPVANAGADQNITLPTNTVTLNGNGADTDGSIASYQWIKISGPTQYTIVSSTQAQTAINNLVQGVYQFELKVTDNLGAAGKDTVSITVNAAPPNQAPVANAGADQNITLPTNTVTLIGSGTDTDGSIASYQWIKISGPTQFTFISPTQPQTITNNLAQGVYQFELKVIDDLGAIGRDTVVITVNTTPNQVSAADAGPDLDITLPTNALTLIGNGTSSDGTIASYQWSKISGPTQFTIVSPTQSQTVINNLIQGVYQFELKITDNLGIVGKDTVIITVNPAAPNQLPIANAGFDQDITLPTNALTLIGNGTDIDGTIASFQWSKISGPTQFTIVSPTQAQTVINNLIQGVYQFELKITDNLGAVGRDTVIITVNPAAPNQPPVANAGADEDITLPTGSVTLVGNASDADGTIASYQWSKVSGPTQFTIASPSQLQTSIYNLVAGVYQFELKVTDNLGALGRDTMIITVNPAAPNQPPVANAGVDQDITLPVNAVTVTGNGTDADGTIASYQWSKISGPTQFTISSATQAQAVINNLAEGIYQFELKVTDDLGSIGRDTVMITVMPAIPNQSPVANAGIDQDITLPTNTVTMTGNGTDADGSIVSYQWSKISGPTQFSITSATQAQTIINNLVEGIYQFELKVTDDLGSTGKDTVTITVRPVTPNQPPVANAGLDLNMTLPTNSVTLVGNASDADGTITSYQWSKVSGPAQFTIASPSQLQTSIYNLVAGVYQFELKVTDNLGDIGRDTVIIIVNQAALNQLPVANAGVDQHILLPTNTTILVGTATDTDGMIASYQWSKVSGPTQFSILSSGQPQTDINNLVEGIYQFELKVTDNLGAIGRDTVTIEVISGDPDLAGNAIVYPNTATSLVNIRINAPYSGNANTRIYTSDGLMTSINVYNSNGVLVSQSQVSMNQQTITKQVNIENLPAGIYFVKLDAGPEFRKTLKFIKMK